MDKVTLSIDDAFDEFGFTAVSEDELKSYEKQLQVEVRERSKELQAVQLTYQAKMEALYKAIMPLLHNLSKNPEKEYILWPNRAEKIKDFIQKIEAIVND
jgi:vacuolar-type H+-ATPase subunit I/STV1